MAVLVLGNTLLDITTQLFDGVAGVDWSNLLLAKVNSTHVTPLFDVTRSIASGNGYGVIKRFHLWYPINKRLVYNDEESGESLATSYWSVPSKSGIGDVFIFDVFAPNIEGTSSDYLTFDPNCTLYWHER